MLLPGGTPVPRTRPCARYILEFRDTVGVDIAPTVLRGNASYRYMRHGAEINLTISW